MSDLVATEQVDGVTVQKEGFTVLAEGIAPIADIVFVHGLQGHPRNTWTFTAPSTNHFNKIFSKGQKKPVEVYWPLDIFKADFSNVRVLTYGYDSHLAGSFGSTANRSGISDHGQNLLIDLEYIRRTDPKRRLIFIAHSLGGLIVKETLRRSRSSLESHLKNIYRSTFAVVFFGTPHRGSSYAQLAKVCQTAAGTIISTNDVLLHELKQNSQFLKLLREEFGAMIQEQSFEVHCFQEGKTLRGFSKLVVDQDSACLEDGRSSHSIINAHHRAMCRFENKSDPGYTKFKGVISRYLDTLGKLKLSENQRTSEAQRLRLNECLQSLSIPAMHERRELIGLAETHTFEWILKAETGFKDWLVGEYQMFWIKGKPGSGKSTLLKYLSDSDEILATLETKWPHNVATVGFYFYDQGNHQTQRSFDGLLLGVLHQILTKLPVLLDVIIEIYELTCNSDGWKRTELLAAFAAISRQKKVNGCICIFIDALDEYGGSPTEIARELGHLLKLFTNSNFLVKICASSRPLPEFEAMLGDNPNFAIDDWTSDDIRQIVSQRLMEVKRGPMDLLSESIVRNAKGVFLWVRLIMEDLSPYMFDGQSEDELIWRLSALPSDLEEFYSHLLERVVPVKQEQIRNILQMIMCDGNRPEPLTLAELSLAAVLPADNNTDAQFIDVRFTADLSRCRDMEKRLHSCLGGFLELVPNSSTQDAPSWIYKPLSFDEYQFIMRTIKFSHKTAKEYVLKRMYSDFFDPQNAVANGLSGHLRLMRLYIYLANYKQGMFYLVILWLTADDDSEYDIHDTYLVEHFLHHAREVEYLAYMSACNRIPILHDASYITLEPPTYLLMNTASQYPTGSVSAPTAWLEVRTKLMDDFNRKMLNHDRAWFKKRLYNSSIIPPDYLTFTILHGLFLCAKKTLDSLDSNSINHHNPPLLYWAIASNAHATAITTFGLMDDEIERCEDFVRYLLQKGADPDAVFKVPYKQKDKWPNTIASGIAEVTPVHLALSWAIADLNLVRRDSYFAIICILLEGGANAGETKYYNYWYLRSGEAREASAIHWLTFDSEFVPRRLKLKNGEEEINDPFTAGKSGQLLCRTLKAFLDHGADPNAVDSHGNDVLLSMMAACPYELVEYALEKGALISPLLLQKDGSPTQKYGILLENRWRRPECYTPEAREMVRKHMPHWNDLQDDGSREVESMNKGKAAQNEDEEDMEEESEDEDEELTVTNSAGGGWIAKISQMVGWYV